MEFKVTKKAIICWIIQGIITFSVIYITLLFLDWINNKSMIWSHLSLIIKYTSIFLILFFFIDVIIGSILRYKNWSYIIKNDRVKIIKKSAILSTYTEVPLNNIQSINTSQNFIAKKFHIMKVELSTLGDIHYIEGLNKEDALIFKEYIMNWSERI